MELASSISVEKTKLTFTIEIDNLSEEELTILIQRTKRKEDDDIGATLVIGKGNIFSVIECLTLYLSKVNQQSTSFTLENLKDIYFQWIVLSLLEFNKQNESA